jgi:hypothetical protein
MGFSKIIVTNNYEQNGMDVGWGSMPKALKALYSTVSNI